MGDRRHDGRCVCRCANAIYNDISVQCLWVVETLALNACNFVYFKRLVFCIVKLVVDTNKPGWTQLSIDVQKVTWGNYDLLVPCSDFQKGCRRFWIAVSGHKNL